MSDQHLTTPQDDVAEAEEPQEAEDAPAEAEESQEAEAEEAPADEEVASDDEPPPPPPAPASPNTKTIKVLPKGFVPLPVVAVGDPRIPAEATTLAEAAICAAVFRQMADNADAWVAAILAADEEMPPFYLDDEDRDLLVTLFARDVALASRIRLAAGSTPRPAVA